MQVVGHGENHRIHIRVCQNVFVTADRLHRFTGVEQFEKMIAMRIIDVTDRT